LDRVLLAIPGAVAAANDAAPIAVVVSADPAATADRLRVATELRGSGLRARADLTPRKLGRQLEAASRDGAHFAVILGADAAGGLQLKDLKAGTQKVVGRGDLVKELERAARTHRHGLGAKPAR
ncbi:MAG: His/Gly/Thr/Pro-type tRNA ligase C-terminal domain-containing protein, partial [Chloroflexi bacterium]|nr:His/Gly/Thr/Pro-type tRNA ligase C-terminal domain-containing protein [Chloroflexota bacterium]